MSLASSTIGVAMVVVVPDARADSALLELQLFDAS